MFCNFSFVQILSSTLLQYYSGTSNKMKGQGPGKIHNRSQGAGRERPWERGWVKLWCLTIYLTITGQG